MLNERENSTSPVAVRTPHFPVFAEFVNASYSARYQILMTRLLREKLYDSACFLLSPRTGQLPRSAHISHPGC
ncbi:MAG: PaeR7I family type II restriction endonuclease [Planctomycetota bacterium]